jgi:hypothetical protein
MRSPMHAGVRNSSESCGVREKPHREPDPIPWITRSPALLALALYTAACGAEPAGEAAGEPLGETQSAIYGGVTDGDGNGSVVALKIGDGQAYELCTAAVIAPNVVLTARHCVSDNIVTGVRCDQNGNSGNGNHVAGDVPVASIHVYSGANPNYQGPPIANGKALFHAGGTILCNRDIALLVLDRNVSIKPLRVRLATTTTKGEAIKAVGYGINDKNLPTGTRLRKDNVGVLAVGKLISSSGTPLGASEFEVGLSICQGDSGGPGISAKTGAVIGVVSRGGDCDQNFGHIYTMTAAHKDIFTRAFASAGGAPLEESAGAAPASADPEEEEATPAGKNAPNLRAGQGSSCNASGAPAPGAASLGGIALGALVALAALFARKKRPR